MKRNWIIASLAGLLLGIFAWTANVDTEVKIRADQIEDAYLRPGRVETISAQYNFQVAQLFSAATTNSIAYFTVDGLLTSTTSPLNGELFIGRTGQIPILANLVGKGGTTIANLPGSIEISSVTNYSISVQTFTGLSTWTKPSGLVTAYVRAVGGGGGGGGADSDGTTESFGAGGGGAGYCERWILAASLGATEDVTIGGAGGGGSAAGGNGTGGSATSFGTLCVANGGDGGQGTGSAPAADAELTGGAGGTATGGDINIAGQTGQNGVVSTGQLGDGVGGGAGGNSILGHGGSALMAITASPLATGRAGVGPGGGGAGGMNATGDIAGAAGGAGVAGRVIVVEFK